MGSTGTQRAGGKAISGKYILWTVMALAALSVLVLNESSIFLHPNPNRARLHGEWPLFVPHALGGLTALLIGPLQFSTRLRQRNLARHRLLGKIYIIAILIAAPTAIVLAHQFSHFDFLANCVQSSLWMLTTLAAYQTARNRQIAAHRQWMIRSYAITFIFIASRVLNPLRWYSSLSDDAFSVGLLLLNIAALFAPDVYFSWRELTNRRA